MITKEELERERRRSLSRLAQVHREWTKRHAQDAPFNADHARPGPKGTDYPLHHLDVSATADQEEEFQQLAAEAMAPFQRMAEEYARQQRETANGNEIDP